MLRANICSVHLILFPMLHAAILDGYKLMSFCCSLSELRPPFVCSKWQVASQALVKPVSCSPLIFSSLCPLLVWLSQTYSLSLAHSKCPHHNRLPKWLLISCRSARPPNALPHTMPCVHLSALPDLQKTVLPSQYLLKAKYSVVLIHGHILHFDHTGKCDWIMLHQYVCHW